MNTDPFTNATRVSMHATRAARGEVQHTSRSYPEQSKRQTLRGMRRAQGGPGLTEGANPQPRNLGVEA